VAKATIDKEAEYDIDDPSGEKEKDRPEYAKPKPVYDPFKLPSRHEFPEIGTMPTPIVAHQLDKGADDELNAIRSKAKDQYARLMAQHEAYTPMMMAHAGNRERYDKLHDQLRSLASRNKFAPPIKKVFNKADLGPRVANLRESTTHIKEKIQQRKTQASTLKKQAKTIDTHARQGALKLSKQHKNLKNVQAQLKKAHLAFRTAENAGKSTSSAARRVRDLKQGKMTLERMIAHTNETLQLDRAHALTKRAVASMAKADEASLKEQQKSVAHDLKMSQRHQQPKVPVSKAQQSAHKRAESSMGGDPTGKRTNVWRLWQGTTICEPRDGAHGNRASRRKT
jgi:hypothetical protein